MKTYEKYLNESKNELKNSYGSIEASVNLWLNIAKRSYPKGKKNLKMIYQTWIDFDQQMKNFINEYEE